MPWRADQQKKKTAILDLLPNRSAINASHRTRPGCAPSLQQRQRVTAGLLFKTPNLFEKSELALLPRAQPAKSDFLHPVCDSAHQQIAG